MKKIFSTPKRCKCDQKMNLSRNTTQVIRSNSGDTRLRKSNSRKISLPQLSDSYSYLVFANQISKNKLDLTKTKNIKAIYTSEDNAKQFARNFSINNNKASIISVVFKIRNGETLNILSQPLVVYYKSPLECILNQTAKELDMSEYDKYLKTKRSRWCCRCLFIC